MFIVHCSCSLFIVPTVLLSSLMMFFTQTEYIGGHTKAALYTTLFIFVGRSVSPLPRLFSTFGILASYLCQPGFSTFANIYSRFTFIREGSPTLLSAT